MLSPASYVSLAGSVLPNKTDARRLAPCASEERLAVLLFLRFAANDSDITERARNLSLQPPGQRTYAKRSDFQPDPRARELIEAFAARHGLRVGWPADCGGLIARLEGSVARCNAAFRVELHDYFSPAGDFRGYEGAVSLPREVAPVVRGVFGLAGRPGPRPSPVNQNRRPGPEELPGPLEGNSAENAARAYRFPGGTGRNQKIGIIEEDAHVSLSDMGTYLGDLGVLRVPEVLTLPAAGDPDEDGFSSGAAYSLQIAAALVPEAAFVLYDIRGYPVDDWQAGFLLALLNALLGSQTIDVLLINPGGPEYCWSRDELNVLSLLFALGACLGISICVPSGDFGAAGFDPSRSKSIANVHFPASSPFVLSCGGTELHFATKAERKLDFEAVWNDLDRSEKPRATGGGISSVFSPPPFYQEGCHLPPSQNAESGTGRGVPDVAANAAPDSGYRLYQNGSWTENACGTTLAAAIWGALLVRINEALGANLGWVNPLLYRFQIAEGLQVCSPVYAAGRENCNGPLSRRFPAAYCAKADANYNACAGLGTPRGESLLNAFRNIKSAAEQD